MEFLKNNFLTQFVELMNQYFEIMGEIIFFHVKNYTQELTKFGVDIYIKSDFIVNENPKDIRKSITLKPEGIVLDERSIFSSMEREKILDNM